MKLSKTLITSAFVASMMLLSSGCGSESNSSDDTTTTQTDEETVTLSGAVADGYLYGAKVCLDTNFNDVCDQGETSAVTDEKGQYTLQVKELTMNAYTILAEADEYTIDMDTGLAIGEKWLFKAKAEMGGFISPLTTLAVNEMELNATMDAKTAMYKIQTALGLDLNISEDYIEANNSTAHTAAQIVARNMVTAGEAIQAAAGGQGDSQLFQIMATEQIRARLGNIAEAARLGDADYNCTVDTSDVVNDLQEINATISAPLSDGLSAGLLYMWEEEKMARDVYAAMYTAWGTQMFENIGVAEQKHMESVAMLLAKYSIEMDGRTDTADEFVDTNLAALYTSLVADGKVSQSGAVAVGVTIEETDIADLETILEDDTLPYDLRTVYENLLAGSQKHLEAFSKHQ